MNIENIPILNSTLNIYDSLLYKSPEFNQYYPQCWLLLDDEHYNYNYINNIKGSLHANIYVKNVHIALVVVKNHM